MDIEKLKTMPVVRLIEVIRMATSGPAFANLTNVVVQNFDEALEALYRDAVDQAAAENDALHGPEVSQLTDVWVSPCGMRVGG